MKHLSGQTVTKTLLWLSFAALLTISVPHVAWFFNEYEPANCLWVGYAAAISIDVVIGWLAYRGSESHAYRTYAFVVGLVALSWLGNYLFDLSHAPTQAGVWAITVAGGVTIGQITPFIVSSLPLLILAYTDMLRTLDTKPTPIALPATSHVEVTPETTLALPAPDLSLLFPFEQWVALPEQWTTLETTPNIEAPNLVGQALPTLLYPTVAANQTVAELLDEGKTLQQIADMRGVTTRTVQRQLVKERGVA